MTISAACLAAACLALPGATAGASTLRQGARQPAWGRLGATVSFSDQAGLLRVPGGRLHLAWRQVQANHKDRFADATLSARGKVLSSGVALSGWNVLEGDPRLIAGGPAIRMVFIGARTDNASDFFSRGAVYTQVSGNGTAWTLEHSSLSSHTVLNLGLAAVPKADKTPVAAFGLNNVLYFHAGLDPNAPAAAPDGSVTGPVAVGLQNPALVRAGDGSVWLAWYEGGPKHGVWVDRILPTKGTPHRAPDSGTPTSADNEPFQQVAFVSRPKGGLFLAYCSPAKLIQCAHIDLWRVGAAHASVVPGSKTSHAGHVALSIAPKGRLWLAWYDSGASKIHVIQTGTSGTGFGKLRTISQPGPAFIFNGLQAEGSAGRLDLIANILVLKPSSHDELWHIQLT